MGCAGFIHQSQECCPLLLCSSLTSYTWIPGTCYHMLYSFPRVMPLGIVKNLLLMYQQHARKMISDHILQIVKAQKKGETFLVQMLSKNHHCKMQSKLHWMSDKGEYIHITLPLINKNMHLFPLEHTHSYQLVQGKAWVGVCVPLDLVDVLWQPYKICRFQTW